MRSTAKMFLFKNRALQRYFVALQQHLLFLIKDLRTTARGPNAVPEDILSIMKK